MPATEKGIYHNLRESKYVISNSEITFYFSSKFYLNKFMDGYHNHREEFKKRMNNLLNDSPYNVSVLADIKFYKTIEKRGFFVRLKNAKILEDDLNKYGIRHLTSRDTLEWVIVSYGKDKDFRERQKGIR